MKYKLFFLIWVTGSLSCQLRKHKPLIPPGTMAITESLFADQTEITNLSWLEYEYWTRMKYGPNSAEHRACLPDTLVWRADGIDHEPFVTQYYRRSIYRNFPVVGISYEQALAFCKWRTERVREYYAIAYKKSLNIEYRLPSREEWELISNNGGGVFSNGGKTEKGLFRCNYLHQDSLISEADLTMPVCSYNKNLFGLFNTIGNVSEMISEKGISKGGSWRHRLEECRPGKDIAYSRPEAWLGFRCVCVVRPSSPS